MATAPVDKQIEEIKARLKADGICCEILIKMCIRDRATLSAATTLPLLRSGTPMQRMPRVLSSHS